MCVSERQQGERETRNQDASTEFSNLAAAGGKRLDENVCVTALKKFGLQRPRWMQRRSME